MDEIKRGYGEGRIFRRKKNGVEVGPLWIGYPGPLRDGTRGEIRESARTLDPKKAERILRDRLGRIVAEDHGGDLFVRPKRVLVSDLIEKDLKLDLAGKAYERTALSASKNLVRLLGDRDARSVNWKTIKEYQAARLTEGASASSIDKETALLVKAFRLAQDDRRVSVIPKRESLLGKHENKREHLIDEGNVAPLIAEVRKEDEDLADWLEWVSICGMRNRETSTLEWRDFREDGTTPTITVRAENAKLRTERTFAVGFELAEIIERRKARRVYLDARGEHVSELVFHSLGRTFEHGSGGLPGRCLRVYARAAEKLGLPMNPPADPERPKRRTCKVEPYALRHHATNVLDAAGVRTHVAEYIVGHANATMHSRYLSARIADTLEAFEKVSAYLAGKRAEPRKLVAGQFGHNPDTRGQ